VLFVVFGGLLLFWSKRVVWIHVPCVLWAIFIEFSGWICPLTPLEISLRIKGGGVGYRSGFIEHYIFPILYPTVLTRRLQFFLGILVFVINLVIYCWAFRLKMDDG
jgi:hypothetical protein